MKASIEFNGEEYTLRVGGGSFRVTPIEMTFLNAAFKACDLIPLRDESTGARVPMRVTVEYGELERPKF